MNGLNETVQKLQTEVETGRDLLKENELLSKELKLIKAERNELNEKISTLDKDMQAAIQELQQTEQVLGQKIDHLETSQ